MPRPITAEEFEELYRAAAPELFGYLRRRMTTDAEDLVAEVFTTAWRRRTELPAPMLRRAWLFGTARRLLLAEARRRGREQDAADQLADQPLDLGTGSAGPGVEIVRAALARLSPSDRELIELVEWERLTPAEVAVALGVRPGTARVRLHRARRALAADPGILELGGVASAPPDPART